MEERTLGFKLGRFELGRLLGEGGMGVVYESYDTLTQRQVALKVLRDLDSGSRAQFKREFRALASLRHPNLVVLHELFEEQQQLFFTMELVRGKDFSSYVREDAQPAAQVAPTARSLEAGPRGRLRSASPLAVATPAPRYDRLRHALSQLANALDSLHQAGLVHRDIKPSNILVQADGRLTLLDFGLVAEAFGAQSTARRWAGTAAYMAPEQASGGSVGPAADWYAVGVLLFQALTSTLPFEGGGVEVLIAKSSRDAPSPRSVVGNLPDDLVRACERLLSRDPATRHFGRKRLHADASASVAATTSQVVRRAAPPPFVGRKRERAQLHEAWQRVHEGGCVLVELRGESGIGKTALVTAAVQELAANVSGSALVLGGRCYERETIHYKGVDGVVESLTKGLSQLGRAEIAALVPRHVGQLAQLFPAFLGLEPFADAARSLKAMPAQSARESAIAALREVLTRIGDRFDVIVHVDDVQWMDADGRAIIDDLLREPDAPRLLWLNTSTSSGAGHHAGSGARVPNLELEVGPLEATDACLLLSEFSKRLGSTLPPNRLEELATEAHCSPIYLYELARHAAKRSAGATELPTLSQILCGRILGLHAAARDVLAVASVAEVPLSREALMLACSLDRGNVEDSITLLTMQRLLLCSGPANAPRAQPSHDRVRRAMLRLTDASELRRLHQRLALTLTQLFPHDHQAIAAHWLGAGQPARAQLHLVQAARAAAAAFAFDRAASLFALALDGPNESGERAALLEGLGDALAHAGRGEAAATALLEAATLLSDAERAQDLRRRAVQLLLRAGHIDRGMEELRPLLAEVQLRLPRGPRASLASLLYHRARLALRGLDHRLREEHEIEPAVIRRLDACWSASTGLGLVDMIRGSDFQARSLLMALDAGEPRRLSRALANEAAVAASEGVESRKRVPALFDMAERLAAQAPHPELEAWLLLTRGIAAMQEGSFEKCLALASRADAEYRRSCLGASWELASAQAFGLWALAYMGRLRELEAKLPALIGWYGDRGDLFAQSNVKTGPVHLLAMARDDVAAMRSDCQHVLSQWAQTGFHFQHMSALFAMTMADIYSGDFEAALERVNGTWPTIERSLLLRVQFFRLDLWYLRGRAALGHLLATGGRKGKSAALVKQAISRIEREDMRWSRGMALALRAGLACAERDTAQAAELLGKAERAFHVADMSAHAAACALQQSLLLCSSDDRGAARLRVEGVMSPERFANAIAPCRAEPRA